MRVSWIAGGLVFAVLCGAASADLIVDTCNQTVPRRETGVLAADLACSGSPGVDHAVVLGRGASLDMAGHTITVLDGSGVLGDHKCRVFSSAPAPGRIVKAERSAVGVNCPRTLIENVEVEGFAVGIGGSRFVKATGVAVTDAAVGIKGGRHKLADTSADGNENGIGASRKVRASNVSASGNEGWGIDAGCTMKGDGVTADGNGEIGIDASSGSDCNGSRIKLVDSQVTGNPLDMLAAHLPRLTNTVCETSESSTDGSTWGVCLND